MLSVHWIHINNASAHTSTPSTLIYESLLVVRRLDSSIYPPPPLSFQQKNLCPYEARTVDLPIFIGSVISMTVSISSSLIYARLAAPSTTDEYHKEFIQKLQWVEASDASNCIPFVFNRTRESKTLNATLTTKLELIYATSWTLLILCVQIHKRLHSY